ncbi:MAG: YaaA family protein [Actinomycetota bacterium]
MTASLPLILLPPSEGKAPGGDGPPWIPGSMSIDLDEHRVAALIALAKAMRGSEAARAKLLGVKSRALHTATEADRDARRSPTRPAIERYTGVLYDALDHGSLTAAQRRRLDESVVIFSGLWGLVAPSDPIPDYKLKMGASLPGFGKLSSWWRDELSARLAERASSRQVWNLLPIEHAAAWRPPDGLPQWTVHFLERRPDGSLAAVSHRNKGLKGALVRHLLAHPSIEPADLRGWGDERDVVLSFI